MNDETRTRTDVGCIEVMDDAMVEVLRSKSGLERLQISWKMWSSAQRMLTCHLSITHPEWSAEQVQKEVARRMSHGTV